MKLIDIHAHIFPGKIREKAVAAIGGFYGIAMEGAGGGSDLVRQGAPCGTLYYCVHSVATKPSQVESINNYLAEEASEHPEFIPFAAMHPALDNIEAELERVSAMGFKGIKLHPDFQCFNIDDPIADRIYRSAGALPILFHMGDATKDFSAPERLARVMDRFPDLKVIAAHFGGYHVWERARGCLAGRPLWFDTSSSLPFLEPQYAVELIHEYGAERMLYGTDYPMWKPAEELERFMALPLTETEREAICYGNGASLLGLQK